MGMYNAIFDDELINPMGIYKERLSQSALVAEMSKVSDEEALAVRTWLDDAGMTFDTGTDEASELTDSQLHSQMKMYVATLRIADDFGLDAVGIQYQQGLKDTVPASDLAEGLLNNVQRPPSFSRDGARELYAGAPLPHFNEVDEGAAVDALVTNRLWTAMGIDPATTLHDVRWGERYGGTSSGYSRSLGRCRPPTTVAIQVLQQAPASDVLPAGRRHPQRLSRPGDIVWSRVFIMEGAVHVDLGRGTVVELPPEETARRLRPPIRSGRSCTRFSTASAGIS